MDAKLRVKVAQRLVHEKRLRLADDCSPEGHPLPLASAQLNGLSPEERLDLKQPGRVIHTPDDILLSDLGILERERHVLVDRHVRIEGVTLEHHRDVPLFRVEVVHESIADVDLPFRRGLEAGEAAQRRRLAAPARSEEDDELLVPDLEVQSLDGDRAVVRLGEPLQLDSGQGDVGRARTDK